jgi:hypothetical protein
MVAHISLKDKLSEPEKAYLAGIFDGEGTIGYYDFRNRHESTVMITNADPRLMNWIMDTIGYGNVHTVKKGYTRRKHVVHHWRISNKPRVKEFLEAIYPYLIVKRDQAELLLSLWNLENPGKNKITSEVKSRRDQVVNKLKLLKTSHFELAETIQ